MRQQITSRISLQVTYDGLGPVYWRPDPDHFGLQDKFDVLHRGRTEADGAVVFEFSLEVKSGRAGALVFIGPFAHGPPAKRFLYLSWRNDEGGYAQRMIISLTSIQWDQVRQAQSSGGLLVCTLVDKHPRTTSTGANIGGARPVAWTVRHPGG